MNYQSKSPTTLGTQLKQLFLNGQGVVTQEAGNYNPAVEKFSKGVNTGTDIGVNPGTPITLPKGQWNVEEAYGGATRGGFIGNADNRGYGNSVLVKNAQTGEQFRFSHLLKPLVQAGQQVQGGVIGYSGNTGNTTGPHVDIEAGGGAYGKILQGMKNIASSYAQGQKKIDLKSVFNNAQQKYGKGLVAVSNNVNKLNDLISKKGGKLVKL